MIVTCENCAAHFRLGDEYVSDDGAKVRCSKCDHTFTVQAERELMEVDEIAELSDDELTALDAEETVSAAQNPSEKETAVVEWPDVLGNSARVDPVHAKKTRVHELAFGAEALDSEPTVRSELSSEVGREGLSSERLEARLLADAPTAVYSPGSSISLESFGARPPLDPSLKSRAATDDGPPLTGAHVKPTFLQATIITFCVSVAGVIMLAGVPYFFLGDAIRERLGFDRPHPSYPTGDGIEVTSMRAVIYPTQRGDALVVTGEAHNTSDQLSTNMYVVARLRTVGGKVAAEQRAPVGIRLGPSEVHALSDASSLLAAQALQLSNGAPSIAAGAYGPYTIVFLEPPRGLPDYVQTLDLEEGEPFSPVPSPPLPAWRWHKLTIQNLPSMTSLNARAVEASAKGSARASAKASARPKGKGAASSAPETSACPRMNPISTRVLTLRLRTSISASSRPALLSSAQRRIARSTQNRSRAVSPQSGRKAAPSTCSFSIRRRPLPRYPPCAHRVSPCAWR